MESGQIIAIILIITPFILGYLLFRVNKSKKEFESKWISLNQKLEQYKDIIDIEEYSQKIKEENIQLDNSIKEQSANLLELKEQVLILDEEKMLQEYGMYKPMFDYEDSDTYKNELLSIKETQKEMIKDKTAALCSTEWQVQGSKAKGRKMTNDSIKLALRVFNSECDASIAKVKYNNVNAIKIRIEKAYDTINNAMKSNHINITKEYLQSKLKELYLTHELKEKQYEEKEEQKRIKEQIREEEKAQKELEKAKNQAEKEEQKYQEALKKARLEVELVTGANHDKMIEQIKKLENQLLEAQQNKERAISRAQMTRSGHVYVISNIGSFGEDVYKIGMTRRLEPLDRVKELGDASVPFLFDIHAMIFSEDAPKLEKELHKVFRNQRVNMINERREFFNVSLDEIKKAVEKNHGQIEFTKLAEAKEYRETLEIKNHQV